MKYLHIILEILVTVIFGIIVNILFECTDNNAKKIDILEQEISKVEYSLELQPDTIVINIDTKVINQIKNIK